jgi:hypothetical protein
MHSVFRKGIQQTTDVARCLCPTEAEQHRVGEHCFCAMTRRRARRPVGDINLPQCTRRAINISATRLAQASTAEAGEPSGSGPVTGTRWNRCTGHRLGAGTALAVGPQRRVLPMQAPSAGGFVRRDEQWTTGPSARWAAATCT